MRPCLLSSASRVARIPSLCGMLVYRDFTSIVAKIVLGGNGVGILNMVCKKWLVSLMYDGSCVHSCLRYESMNDESLSVGESHPDMIGLPGLFGLCILGKR